MATKKNPKKKAAAVREAGTCFTIMPFGGYFDAYYKTLYEPAIVAAGLKPVRADDFFASTSIVDDIWREITSAKVILADLSGRNANVFYELGLAHAARKPVVLITSALEDVPFDLRALRVIVYDKNAPDWGVVLNRAITNALQETLASPQSRVLAPFLQVEPSHGPKVSQHDKDIAQLGQELASLRQQVGEMHRKERERQGFIYGVLGPTGATGGIGDATIGSQDFLLNAFAPQAIDEVLGTIPSDAPMTIGRGGVRKPPR